MNILITGITGFAGSHLADYILTLYEEELMSDDIVHIRNQNHKVFGLRHWRSRLENVQHLLDNDKITLIEADLKDENSLIRALELSKPDRIFHLAAHSYVPTSWKMPAEVMNNNAVGEINLLEAVRKVCPKAKIQLAGSSEEYGLVKPDEVPIKETNDLRPLSTYGVSKVAQDYLGYQYYKSYGMWIVRTRAFNHTGPRRGEVFVCSTFAKQIAEIEAGVYKVVGQKPGILTGNLDTIRDFTDVRDMVRAYWWAIEKGTKGEVYNIGSGESAARSMKSVLNILLSLSDVRIEIVQDPDRIRPSDVPILVCNASKFRKKTGWDPVIPFKETMRDLLNYWRKKIGGKYNG